MSLTSLTAVELGKKIKAKEVTVKEALEAVFAQIDKSEEMINSYVNLYREEAFQRAEEVQKKIDAGELTGPLAGVPVAIKDNICTKGMTTTCSSKILYNFVPTYTAQAVENLRKARQTLGERAKILAGIMPVVSQRNAIFMENEINGIHVEEDIIQRFAGLDREQGEALGLEVSMQMAREALPYADGFYLMTPFNRVALMERLIARLKTELLDAEG